MRGFTLFEILIYIAILASILYFIGGFAYNVYMGSDRVINSQDINTNGRFMIDTMTRSVENAEVIISM